MFIYIRWHQFEMNSNNLRYIPNQSIRKILATKLNLEFNESSQDWEYEVSDPSRIQEFMDEYDKTETSDRERESLMEIILDSANDLLLDNGYQEFDKFISWINNRLERNQEIHQATMNYWNENDFEISNRLKK